MEENYLFKNKFDLAVGQQATQQIFFQDPGLILTDPKIFPTISLVPVHERQFINGAQLHSSLPFCSL